MKKFLYTISYLVAILDVAYELIWINICNNNIAPAERPLKFLSIFPHPSTFILVILSLMSTAFLFWSIVKGEKQSNRVLNVIVFSILILWLGLTLWSFL